MRRLHAVIDAPDALHARATGFWSAALGWPVGDPWPGRPERCSLEPPDGSAYVHVQRTDGPARVHVDAETGPMGSTGATPGPVTWPDGHRTRLVQVCIDSPADVHDAEVASWRSLLGERWVDSAAPEFAGKWHDDDGGPLQLLFQRLDEPSGPVRAHLDLGSDDVPADVRRLVGLGATDVGEGRGWHVLRDPVGLLFCVTENSPEATRHRDLG
jgi:hypothetical protein